MKCTSGNYHYLVTGTDIHGRRFRIQSNNFIYISHINLYRGSLWEVDPKNGKRKLIKRVWN